MVVNNLIYDPGPRALHYNLIAEEWGDHARQTGRMTAIGNVLRAGPSTPGIHRFHDARRLRRARVVRGRQHRGRQARSAHCRNSAVTPRRPVQLVSIERPQLPGGVKLLPAADVQDAVIRNAGARPWDRDAVDASIVADTIEGRGGIIDSEQEVGGYPGVSGDAAGIRPGRLGPALHDPKVTQVPCWMNGTFSNRRRSSRLGSFTGRDRRSNIMVARSSSR